MNTAATERRVTVYQVDAFTETPLSGNPAGVVTDAEGLSDADMLAIAREMNISETAFLLPPQDETHDIHIRYFTPRVEVPICGHATIAAHTVNAMRKGLSGCALRMRTKAGDLLVEVVQENGAYRVRMIQARPEFHAPLGDGRISEIASALGVMRESLRADLPVQVVSTGHSKVLVPFRRREDIDALHPDFGALARLSPQIGSNGYFCFVIGEAPRGALTYGRMFAPAVGIAEDPVTGNANGPLGAYIVKHKAVSIPAGRNFSFKAAQGDAMGRPGEMHVDVVIENGEPVNIAITGSAVIVMQAEMRIA